MLRRCPGTLRALSPVRQKYLNVTRARIAISANTRNATPKMTRHGVRSAACSDDLARGASGVVAGFIAGAGCAVSGVAGCGFASGVDCPVVWLVGRKASASGQRSVSNGVETAGLGAGCAVTVSGVCGAPLDVDSDSAGDAGFATDGFEACGAGASARALSISCRAVGAGSDFAFAAAEDVVVFIPASPRYQHLRPALRSVW